MFSYKPLFKLLVEKDMNKENLLNAIKCGRGTIAKLSKNEYVSMRVLDDICKYFHCSLSDVVEFYDETQQEEEE